VGNGNIRIEIENDERHLNCTKKIKKCFKIFRKRKKNLTLLQKKKKKKKKKKERDVVNLSCLADR